MTLLGCSFGGSGVEDLFSLSFSFGGSFLSGFGSTSISFVSIFLSLSLSLSFSFTFSSSICFCIASSDNSVGFAPSGTATINSLILSYVADATGNRHLYCKEVEFFLTSYSSQQCSAGVVIAIISSCTQDCGKACIPPQFRFLDLMLR